MRKIVPSRSSMGFIQTPINHRGSEQTLRTSVRKPRTFSPRLFMLLFIASLLISLLFLFGETNQDTFSFYVVGRGVVEGGDLFADFAVNKGPVNFLFYAILYFIFRDNYQLAFIAASTILDFLAVVFITKLVWLWFGKADNKYFRASFMIFTLLFYKFTLIGSSMAGVFSESLAVPLVLMSLYFYWKKKSILPSLFFALSLLTRPTVLFFGFVLVVKSMIIDKNYSRPIVFGLCISFWLIVIVAASGFFGNIEYFIRNVFVYNISYVKAVGEEKWLHLISVLIYEPKIFFSLIFTFVFGTVFLIFNDISRVKKSILFSLMISSTLSIFIGGYFYDHHYSQFALLFISVMYLTFISRFRVVGLVFMIGIVFFLGISGYIYVQRDTSYSDKVNIYLEDYLSKRDEKYVKVVTFYPEIYIKQSVYPPDRYFHSFFLLDGYSTVADIHREEHADLRDEILKDTIFVVVYVDTGDVEIGNEYMNTFRDVFKLRRDNVYFENDTPLVEIYVSEV